ncbi:ATP-binding protein [Thiopseudomonas denitrificans]|uniref:histidine kinase n=1 Tax=Thiopseudomonas denitrificans TaxID=1501432 RepID=A0A4R6U0Y6_9GAMM|nr:ATP-binding protein [Thiopseudomonas denitrificans]TDQ39960.1 two-component sensor kinase CbrA [Thiopseudomonas denitrificans]
MTISVIHLTGLAIGYLLTLFATAWLAEKNLLPRQLVRHPLIYTLSLGVYASAWAFYGSVGLAHQYGYGFLAIYLGISGAFLLAPVLLYPLLELTRTHQLASLADLFAFRFRSTAAGTLTTLGLLLCTLPLLALQIQAVADTAQLLTGSPVQENIALVFCLIITLFSILFGARHIATREKHQGVVFAMAFESLLKLLAILAVAGWLLYQLFDGPAGLQQWLSDNKAILQQLQQPMQDGQWRVLLLLFFAAVIVMPHMFHMAFTENLKPRSLVSASWGLPLFLLLLSLPIPLILWAGLKLGVTTEPQYFAIGLGLALNNETLALLSFMGGMSAASGVIIVCTIALSGMVLNHLILPVYQPPATGNIYGWLKWTRRLLIAAIILASFVVYLLLGSTHQLSSLGVVSFAGGLQFLPGVMALLYWPKANRNGFMAGTLTGLLIWAYSMLLPTLGLATRLPLSDLGLDYLSAEDSWQQATALAIIANSLVFALVSLLSSTRQEEQISRQTCLVNRSRLPESRRLQAGSPHEFAFALSKPLGSITAQREVQRALSDLQLPMDESRPFALRRLRDRIEANLSGLLGPGVARDLVSSFLPYQNAAANYVTEDIHFIENRLEDYRSRLTGLAAELDAVRRHHRQTLHNLPLGVCALSREAEITLWNLAMENLTGIGAARVLGSPLESIDAPWRDLLVSFSQGTENRLHKKRLHSSFQSRWLNLHKAAIAEPGAPGDSGMVLLVEDITENRQLEDQLIHAQRLASLGRLAAGVAHEIGNPVTGIACLAQIIQEERTSDEELQEISGQIIEQTRRITRIVQSMMGFSRSGQPHDNSHEALCWLEVCKDAVNLLSLNTDAQSVEFRNLCQPDHWIKGDPQRLSQVVVNLLGNARDASPPGGLILMATRAGRDWVELSITDQGSGIAPEHQSQLFEPFFTTKDPGEGTGLGLAMAYSIVREHQGDIRVTSPLPDTPGGTRFCIRLPRSLPAPDTPG